MVEVFVQKRTVPYTALGTQVPQTQVLSHCTHKIIGSFKHVSKVEQELTATAERQTSSNEKGAWDFGIIFQWKIVDQEQLEDTPVSMDCWYCLVSIYLSFRHCCARKSIIQPCLFLLMTLIDTGQFFTEMPEGWWVGAILFDSLKMWFEYLSRLGLSLLLTYGNEQVFPKCLPVPRSFHWRESSVWRWLWVQARSFMTIWLDPIQDLCLCVHARVWKWCTSPSAPHLRLFLWAWGLSDSHTGILGGGGGGCIEEDKATKHLTKPLPGGKDFEQRVPTHAYQGTVRPTAIEMIWVNGFKALYF